MKTRLFAVSVASILGATFLGPLSVEAADYCITTTYGDRMCVHATYGPRGNRRMVISRNGGTPMSYRYDCYNESYARTSIVAYGCWAYTGISSDPTNYPEDEEISDSLRGILESDGFLPEDKAIDIEKAKNAIPDEMK